MTICAGWLERRAGRSTMTPWNCSAGHAGGALRDALGLLEQAASFTGGAINRADLETLVGAISPESLRSVADCSHGGGCAIPAEAIGRGVCQGLRARQVLYQLIDLVRDRLFATATPGPERN